MTRNKAIEAAQDALSRKAPAEADEQALYLVLRDRGVDFEVALEDAQGLIGDREDGRG